MGHIVSPMGETICLFLGDIYVYMYIFFLTYTVASLPVCLLS